MGWFHTLIPGGKPEVGPQMVAEVRVKGRFARWAAQQNHTHRQRQPTQQAQAAKMLFDDKARQSGVGAQVREDRIRCHIDISPIMGAPMV